MAEPSSEDVAHVISIIMLGERDSPMVSSALKAKNNNIEQVVNEYFDNPAKIYSWDENAFSADRDGSTDNQVPLFPVYPPDNSHVIQGVEPNYHSPGAPSRPPSRANNRSPLRTVLPTSSEQEDADLQRAIAESVATSGIQSPQPLPQESGITQTDTSLPYFGPATRTGYDQDQWAMVTLNRETQEPGPSRRKRNPGVPAFLRCRGENSWQTHRLGAILTIFHSIPAARNALLQFGEPAQSYGHNPEWWKGTPIIPPGIQAAQNAGEVTWADEAKPVWSEELHRLMAFLEATERSYGTADMLADTKPEGSLSSGDCEKDFFEYMRNEAMDTEKISPMMATAEIVKVIGDAPGESDQWSLLEPSFLKEKLMMADNLYHVWDMIFFMDADLCADLDSARMAMITQPAEVMTIRFRSDDGFVKPIVIPEVFYIDRYLASHKEDMSRLQQDMSILAQGVAQAQKAEESLTKFFDPVRGTTVDRVTMCNASIAKNKEHIWRLKAMARWRGHEGAGENGDDRQHFPMGAEEDFDSDVEYTPEESKLKQSFEADIMFYQRKLVDIERKLMKIKARKKACEEAFHELGTLLTVPSEAQRWNPTHGYTLRGIANSPDIFYVCLPAEPDLMDIDSSDGGSARKEQWWKLGFVADDDEPVKAEMSTYEKAVEDAAGVGTRPILVYASEKAMKEDCDPLSEALQTFVRFDNRLFRQEVNEESSHERKRSAFASPSSPSKRRNRSSSIDSMATNRASAGDLDDDMRDAPFEVEDPFLGGDGPMETELQDLVDTSVPDETFAHPQAQQHTSSSHPDTDDVGFESGTLNLRRDSAGPASNASLDTMLGDAASPPELPQRPGVSNAATDGARSPEMQERRGASPFLAHSANGKAIGGSSSMDMELDDQQEDQ